MSRQIRPQTTIEQLKKDAKRWLKALWAGDDEARVRFVRALPNAPTNPTLRDVQHATAREFGLSGWTALLERIGEDTPLRHYERVVDALLRAYSEDDESALRIVWEYFGHRRTFEAMRRYVRADLGRHEETRPEEETALRTDEGRNLVARAQGFVSWDALAAFMSTQQRTTLTKPVALYDAVEPEASDALVRSRDWPEALAHLADTRYAGLFASGQMTDAVLARVSRIDHVTSLVLNDSKELTDEGLRHLANLPKLRHLNLAGCHGITDRGLEVLRHLAALESIDLSWTRVTDAGTAYLAGCPAIRRVNLSATACGDGAIRALGGTTNLHEFRSGTGVTDAGIASLHDLPIFKTWHQRPPANARQAGKQPNLLALQGPFTDAGMRHLVGLDGLAALDIGDERLALTGAGVAPLAELPRLEWLAFDANDESMASIATLPHLRFLMCQDTSAGDEGFIALSRSQSIESIWGRRCHNLQRHGFVALARMPRLRYLSVSCKNVDDEGIAALPSFPALRELMPMDVPDAGYRHIGRCERLEYLQLMYCRETGDEATRQITPLRALKQYFASYTRITDRTPEILSGMDSLEAVTFNSCVGLTTSGIRTLARLPLLRELSVSGMPGVTSDVVVAFGPHVVVRYEV